MPDITFTAKFDSLCGNCGSLVYMGVSDVIRLGSGEFVCGYCYEPSLTQLSLTQCSAVTRKGTLCKIPAPPGSPALCHYHDPKLQCGFVSKRRNKRCTVPTGGRGRCYMHGGVDAPSPVC